MNILTQMLKKLPWYGYVAGGIFIIILWQSLSGWAMSRKYFNMILNQIKTDQTQIIKEKEEWIKTCEEEIKKLDEEKARIQKDKLALQKKNADSEKEIARLIGENHDLKDIIDHIVSSDDPDRLIADLQSRGINIRRIPH
jgi:chromosome segregation ATPase